MNAEKLNRSTTLSIIYIACCSIVLMCYNEMNMWRLVLRLRQADIYLVLADCMGDYTH